MLKKLFKAVAEQPYRYITINGFVDGKPPIQRFFHTAEFKAVAAVTLVNAAFLSAVHGVDAEANIVLAGAVFMGYGTSRYAFAQSLKLTPHTEKVILDTQPEEGRKKRSQPYHDGRIQP